MNDLKKFQEVFEEQEDRDSKDSLDLGQGEARKLSLIHISEPTRPKR